MATQSEELLSLFRDQGVVRPRELDGYGIPRMVLTRLLRDGVVERSSRGIYVLASAEPTEHHDLAEACKRIPTGIICLLSALRFHGLTTQAPFEVWLAIDRRTRLPRVGHPPLRVVRFPMQALTSDITEHTIEGVRVRVTNPARTVVDCFVYRNKIGLDVAMEALRDCWRRRRATMDELHRVARVRRMVNVMRPYLETLA